LEVNEVGLGLNERYAVIKETVKRYQKTGKKEKSRILDEFLELTGYNRKYAIHVLANCGKKKRFEIDGRVVEATVVTRQRKKYRRKQKYDDDVKTGLIKIWIVYECICGKRLRSVLKWQSSILRKYRTFAFSEPVWEKLSSISASTIDRLLKTERPKEVLRGRSYTKPGSLLKHHIPIRRGTDWDEKEPGFFEADLVGHDGGNASGDFAFSLNMTDVATGWTEPLALKNKAQKWAFAGILEVEGKVPMKLRGIDSDNGGEFINAHLYRYCESQGIKFTRSRPNRKNDNCFVEQKNYSVIRRYVGYFRYDTDEEIAVLNELYSQVRLHINFFLPSMKLKEKVRVGSKIIKKYDEAKTPYQRLRESGIMTDESRKNLEKEFEGLNVVAIQRSISDLQIKLEKMVLRKQKSRERSLARKVH
jgi:hypothetical protein